MDLGILIDVSNYIMKDDYYEQTLDFVKDFINAFDISPSGAHVALMRYERLNHGSKHEHGGITFGSGTAKNKNGLLNLLKSYEGFTTPNGGKY